MDEPIHPAEFDAALRRIEALEAAAPKATEQMDLLRQHVREYSESKRALDADREQSRAEQAEWNTRRQREIHETRWWATHDAFISSAKCWRQKQDSDPPWGNADTVPDLHHTAYWATAYANLMHGPLEQP